jgi:hypothetical protein
MKSILVIGLVTQLAVTTPATAQDQPPLLQRVAWKLADFVILGDSAYGVQLLASPNLRSEQGRERVATTSLSLDPAVAHHWASGVARIVDSVSRLSSRERKVFETVPLATNLGAGRLLVAFDGKGSERQPFAFVVSDSPQSWWVPVSNDEVQKLLSALETIASHSSVSLAPIPAASSPRALLVCQLDERPEPIERPRLHHPDNFRRLGRNARVLARYVIDTTGVIAPDNIRFVLTDGKDFSREVERALLDSRYRPGRKEGRVVDTVVWEWFVFYTTR